MQTPKTPVVQRGPENPTPGGAFIRAILIAVFVTGAVIGLLQTVRPLLDALDHWTADLRTAFFTYQLPSQHKTVAFVIINEEAIQEAQKDSPTKYRSPIDRDLLARVVTRLDELGAKAIGLDVLVDQASEPQKDAAMMAAIRSAKSQVVLARLDFAEGRAQLEPEQRAYHERFLAEAGRKSGYVTARSEIDGIVRAQATGGSEDHSSFAEELAKAGGWTAHEPAGEITRPSDRIAWLRPPRDNTTTFLTIPATLLILPASELLPIEAALLKSLTGRIAIVGVRFNDRTDRHKTPLNRSESDLMPGPEIHAHVVAQLLDGRNYLELRTRVQLALCFVLAFLGALLCYRYRNSDLLVGILPLLVYICLGVALFWSFKMILPFATPMLAWLGGVYVARLVGLPKPQTNVVRTA